MSVLTLLNFVVCVSLRWLTASAFTRADPLYHGTPRLSRVFVTGFRTKRFSPMIPT